MSNLYTELEDYFRLPFIIIKMDNLDAIYI